MLSIILLQLISVVIGWNDILNGMLPGKKQIMQINYQTAEATQVGPLYTDGGDLAGYLSCFDTTRSMLYTYTFSSESGDVMLEGYRTKDGKRTLNITLPFESDATGVDLNIAYDCDTDNVLAFGWVESAGTFQILQVDPFGGDVKKLIDVDAVKGSVVPGLSCYVDGYTVWLLGYKESENSSAMIHGWNVHRLTHQVTVDLKKAHNIGTLKFQFQDSFVYGIGSSSEGTSDLIIIDCDDDFEPGEAHKYDEYDGTVPLYNGGVAAFHFDPDVAYFLTILKKKGDPENAYRIVSINAFNSQLTYEPICYTDKEPLCPAILEWQWGG